MIRTGIRTGDRGSTSRKSGRPRAVARTGCTTWGEMSKSGRTVKLGQVSIGLQEEDTFLIQHLTLFQRLMIRLTRQPKATSWVSVSLISSRSRRPLHCCSWACWVAHGVVRGGEHDRLPVIHALIKPRITGRCLPDTPPHRDRVVSARRHDPPLYIARPLFYHAPKSTFGKGAPCLHPKSPGINASC